jgi:hypothetical protein
MGIKLVVNNKMNVKKFRDIFVGLERAHGVTYVDKKGNGEKIKGKFQLMMKTNVYGDV